MQHPRSVLLALALGLSVWASAENVKTPPTVPAPEAASARFDALLAALRQSLSQPSDGPVDELIAALRREMGEGNYPAAMQLLEQNRLNFAPRPEALAALEKLLAHVQAAQTAADLAAEQEFGAFVADLSAKIKTRAPASAFDALLTQLSQLRVPRGRPPAGPPRNQSAHALRQFVSRWQEYLFEIERGHHDVALRLINDLINQSADIPALARSELLAVQTTALALHRAALVEKVAGERTRIDQLIASLPDRLDRAHHAADLDVLLTEIAQARPAIVLDGGNFALINPLNARLESARNFVQRWQEYLAQVDSGNSNAAQTSIRSLATDNSPDPVYPRSRLLARINGTRTESPGTSAAADALPLLPPDQLTLETIDQLAEQLRSPRASTDGLLDLQKHLTQLRSARAQLQLGNTQLALGLARGTDELRVGPYVPALTRLTQQLLLAALALQIQPPENLRPTDGESAVTYLARLLQTGRDARDWPLVYRTLQVRASSLGDFAGPDRTDDLIGFRHFMSALTLERAGQYTPAVRAYLSSLRSAGPSLPVEEIGRRLREIKAAYPADYEAGVNTPDPLFLRSSGPEPSAAPRPGTAPITLPAKISTPDTGPKP